MRIPGALGRFQKWIAEHVSVITGIGTGTVPKPVGRLGAVLGAVIGAPAKVDFQRQSVPLRAATYGAAQEAALETQRLCGSTTAAPHVCIVKPLGDVRQDAWRRGDLHA
jgi:hypothetical protein